ncbi:Integrase catalytic domain-containing protein [Aphis craccivora]|uniref:Integrase catalytic domain-containing protein n=1 Tax=Aphis craccivora TaxID=307492 RepID=A0A6G0Y081_APHCR|nr:Integrase catalytic domain-containing protein [Aphis craccivora]
MLQYKPSTVSNVINTGNKKQFVRTTARLEADSQTNNQSSICTQNHIIYKCNTFMKSKPSEQLNLAKRAKLCFNCLRTTHGANRCTNEKACKNCGLRHHTLLHLDIRKVSTPEGENTSSDLVKEHGFQSTMSQLGAAYPTTPQNVILSTVLVHVSGKNGRTVLCRALLDSGSQSHFVTLSLITELGVNRIKTRVLVNGISSAETTVTEMAEFTVTSRLNHKQYQITGLVTPRITVDLPVDKLVTSSWHHLQGIQLADPTFHLPGKIDMLIGAELFYDIVQDGKHVGPKGTPILQNSRFGWIVAGCSNNIVKNDLAHITTNVITCCTTYQQLENQIENFWNIEEVPRTLIPKLGGVYTLLERRKHNDALRPIRLERHLTTAHPMLKEKPKEFFVAKNKSLTSYHIAFMVAQQKNHIHTIKPSILKSVEIVLGEENELALDIQDQLIHKLKNSIFFAIQCDESTDVANCCQLLVYCRFINEKTITEELMFSQALISITKGSDVLSAIENFFD